MRSERKEYRQRDHCARRNHKDCVPLHLANMRPDPDVFQPETLPQSN
jgi:hypothetical protein